MNSHQRLAVTLFCTVMFCTLLFCTMTKPAVAQVAVRGKTVYTMGSAPIQDGMIVIKDGKISAVGKADELKVPDGFEVLQAEIVTPGLIDAHSTVGLSGIFNVKHDQDQLDGASPLQPELRALDAYNSHEELIAWVRSFGVTTLHTGHAPGELISGQTMIVKTVGNTVEDAVIVPARAVSVTLSDDARKMGDKSPGTRGKMLAMLRGELIKAREYAAKQRGTPQDKSKDAPPRDLRMETLSKVLDGELKLMITAQRAQDIASAMRLAKEFQIPIWLDGAAESYLLIDEIKAASIPVILHPSMARATDDNENMSFETAAKLVASGIPVAMQSGYEPYVPKTRVVLFEAALTAANGLNFEQTLATITRDAARILGVADRVGSLEVGKDGDVALYDGDPFEYTTHCIGVVINGKVVSRGKR